MFEQELKSDVERFTSYPEGPELSSCVSWAFKWTGCTTGRAGQVRELERGGGSQVVAQKEEIIQLSNAQMDNMQ